MPEYSGSGFRAHNLYKRLVEKHTDIKVNVISSSTEHNRCLEYDYEGFKVQRIANKKYEKLGVGFFRKMQIAANFKAEWQLTRKYLRSLSEQPDLIHVFGKSYVTATVLDYARKKKIPAVIELCNEMDSPFQFVPFLNRLKVSPKLPGNYLVVCISEMLKKMALRNGIPDQNIWCRPNPVDENRFLPVSIQEKWRLRKQFCHFAEDDKVISYIAKFRPSKNHIFLVDVLKELPEQYKLILGGPLVEKGPEYEKHQANFNSIKEKIEESGLSNRVQVFADFVSNIEDYYKLSDVFAFPTLQEALGTPMLESISCATPVVANNLKDVTDIWIRNGENGFVSSMEVAEFAEKIQQACAIPREDLLQSAVKLEEIAGTKAIDKQYINKIKDLIK